MMNKIQEYGWEVFQAIEKWCRTESGYASIRNVDVDPKNEYAMKNLKMDTMETFILAETFKYLYLLFSPADVVSLDKFVFNTEAHPFIRKKWNWDRIFNKKDE
jgi:mannosyl-oligosaccharide alpha-1,2-mannosidase